MPFAQLCTTRRYLRPAALLNASALFPPSLLWLLLVLLVDAALQDSILSRCNVQGLLGAGGAGQRTVCVLLNLGAVCLGKGRFTAVIRAPLYSLVRMAMREHTGSQVCSTDAAK